MNDLPICNHIDVVDGSFCLVHPLTADMTRLGSLFDHMLCSTAGGAVNAEVKVTVAWVAIHPLGFDEHATAVDGMVSIHACTFNPLSNILYPGANAT